MTEAPVNLRKRLDHPFHRAAARAAQLVDGALAPRIDRSGTVIVSGFWRSGTTWLQNSLAEVLDAKIIFEPFNYHVPDMQPVFARSASPAGIALTNMFMPYTAGDTVAEPDLRRVIDAALDGSLRCRWVRLYRLHWRDTFRTRVVVKFTRAALILRSLQATCGSPVIHIYRDPRAVIASAIYKTGNMGGHFTDAFSLARQLLAVADGRAAYFERWADSISSYDREPLPVRVAVYWALTERFLADSYAARPSANAVFIRYEQLAAAPEKELTSVLEALGVTGVRSDRLGIIRQTSLTAARLAEPRTQSEMVSGWRNVIPAGEQAAIAAVAAEFGFADRLVES